MHSWEVYKRIQKWKELTAAIRAMRMQAGSFSFRYTPLSPRQIPPDSAEEIKRAVKNDFINRHSISKDIDHGEI